MSYVINYFYTSHTGKCRKTNQDNFLCVTDHMDSENCGTERLKEGCALSSDQPVFGVFDGMGGEECGEMAAYIAAKELLSFPFGKDVAQSCIGFCKKANEKICAHTRENHLTSMGTTAAFLKFSSRKIYLCNVGDSKIFQLTDGTLQQISHDHVAASVFGKKPPLLQNLGIPESELIISPYVAAGEYHSGDTYLLCSDGLTDMLTMPEIEKLLREKTGASAAEQLLEQALERGGKDNITLILIHIEKNKRKLFNFNK